MTTGQQSNKRQDQPTSRRQQPTRTSTSQMKSRSSKKQERQKAFQHHSSQQHKKGSSTILHIYYTGAGVLYVYKQVRQPPKTAQQNTASSITNFHSHRCRNRLVHGSTDRRQNTKHAISVNMHSTIPDRMWQNTRSAQQHCLAARQ